MTAPREPGFYWVRLTTEAFDLLRMTYGHAPDERWIVVERRWNVTFRMGKPAELDAESIAEWGPRIEPPAP